MNEECHLDAAPAPAPGRENNAAPFPMAYAQCRLALSRRAAGTGRPEPGGRNRPPEPGRRNQAAGTGPTGRRSSRAGVAGCA
jgi:hypothetical protein